MFGHFCNFFLYVEGGGGFSRGGGLVCPFRGIFMGLSTPMKISAGAHGPDYIKTLLQKGT